MNPKFELESVQNRNSLSKLVLAQYYSIHSLSTQYAVLLIQLIYIFKTTEIKAYTHINLYVIMSEYERINLILFFL